MGGIAGRGKIKLASASTPSVNEPHFSPHSKLKPIIKAQFSGKLVTSGTSDAATTSVNSEKTCMKKLMMMMKMIIIIIIIIIIMNKSQETTVFHMRQKLTSAMKQRPEK